MARLPQRDTKFRPEQEKLRFQLTLQGFDRAQWRAAFGSVEDLQDWVADPQGFIDRRLETVIILSDQIPFWVKIGKLRVLMAAWESGQKLRKSYKSHKISSASNRETQVTQPVEELI